MSEQAMLPQPGYEPRDVSVVDVLISAALVLAGTGAALAVSAAVYTHAGGGAALARAGSPASSFRHGPDAQTSIERSWDELDPLVRERLDSYGWIDRGSGIVRIPIRRAMELEAEALAGSSDETPQRRGEGKRPK